jgi:hypothetical protein
VIELLVITPTKGKQAENWLLVITPTTAEKLEYIHQNPCTEKWMLSKFPDDYKYSSCRFYYNQLNEFDFITHINEL